MLRRIYLRDICVFHLCNICVKNAHVMIGGADPIL